MMASALMKAPKPKPFERWQRVADLVRLAAVSSRVANIEAPINVMLVGPPGDGKTRMILRTEHLAHVQVLSDTTYLGVVQFLRQVKDGLYSTLVIPDMGTIVARQAFAASQTMAALAMMTAEGVRQLRIGKRVMDFGGARASFLSAITPKDLDHHYDTLNQNAFLSRVLLVDFDLSWTELMTMMERKHRGDLRLVNPLSFRHTHIRKGLIQPGTVTMAETYARRVRSWWTTIKTRRQDRFFGFRSGDFLAGLLQSSAFLHGDKRVRSRDVLFVQQRILPLVMDQIRIRPEGNT